MTIMKRNAFLYVTTFLCGASIMGVEIASSRFMAPYFGSSMITWTIIIGVILVAISLGNFIGGRMADHQNPESRLYQLILWASIWVALIPVVGKHIIVAISGAAIVLFPENPILVGSFLACAVLFAVPCLILGAASPCVIKVATRNLDNNGQIAGEIYALSTLGSIFGTFLPTFLTIPTLGTNRTFFLFAGILALLALLNALRSRLGGAKPGVALLLIVILAVTPSSPSFAFWEKPLCEAESIYNYLLINRKDNVTTLSTHVFLGVQSMYAPEMGLTDLCYDLALLSHYFLKPAEKPEKVPVLVLGFATGTFAKLCRKYFPDSQIDGVEIDPGIVEAGRKYFALTDDDARVFVDDGRAFLTKTDKKYRIIFLDAFQDVTYPFHMATREFFQQLMRNLSDDGVLVINVNMRSQIKPDLVSYLTGTLQGLFPKVMLCTHPDYYNRVFFVSRDGQIFDNFKANFAALPIDHQLFKLAQRAFPGLKDAEKSDLVLTDDLAPVELIGFKVLNEQLRTAFREVLVRTILQLKDAI